MIAHKHITKIIAVIMSLAVCLCLCSVVFSEQIAAVAGDAGISMEYEKTLFDTDDVISVNILMDEADWEDMLENAISEEYYQCDVQINGTIFYKVAIRPKGNTSLSSIVSDPTTDRYSFKLEFDHYVDGQTCFGLDKLILNNNYADATNMKEALIYDMYQYLGADASLYNYAKISVNGEYWGVYLALEAVEDSFMLRNYGTENGNLYKPENMDMGGNADENFQDKNFQDMDFSNMPNMIPPDFENAEDSSNPDNSNSSEQTQENFAPPQNSDSSNNADQNPDSKLRETPETVTSENSDETTKQNSDINADGDTEEKFSRPDFKDMGDMPDTGGGGFSRGGNGADLNYTDDDLDSYSIIWDGEVTKTKKADHKRVVTALKNISEGNDLESYMDIDNLLRYMAVHVFSVNEDSLSGMMAHNYYLYESGGKLNMIPWDYNLAFGGMGNNNDATDVVNDAIDNAFSATTFFDTLMENETWHNQYYEYLQELVDSYINGGAFDAFYERVRSQIDELVKEDPTAFYSYEEYQTAADTLYQVVKMRGESIQGQLDGSIPSTEEEQRSSDSLIDASAVDMSTMGSMNGGGGGERFGFPMEKTETEERSDSAKEETSGSTKEETAEGKIPETAETETSEKISTEENEKITEESEKNSQRTEKTDSENIAEETDKSETTVKEDSENTPKETTGEEKKVTSRQDFDPLQLGGQMPGAGTDNHTEDTSSALKNNLILYGITLLVLIATMTFAILYRRKPRKR